MSYSTNTYDRFQEPRETPAIGPDEFTYRNEELFLHRCCVVFGLEFDVVREDDGFVAWNIRLDGKPLNLKDPTENALDDAIRAHYAAPHGQVTLYEAWEAEVE